MRRSFATACVIALLAATSVLAQRGMIRAERFADPPHPKPTPKQRPKPKAKETPIEKWNRMTPEERQRALEKLPPERRREIQQKLQQFHSLPPAERQQLQQRYQAFSQLPPEQQAHARELFKQFNGLPEDRRPMVRQEFEQLRSMPESERSSRMNSEAFRGRFTPSEQQMLQDLTRVFGRSP
jgi:hypothetical protein